MFGYIRINRDELKIKEYRCFKAYYCGVCKAISRRYGFAARMGLSYDAAFLALLRCAVLEEEPQAASCSCIANPLAKRPVVCENTHIAYAAMVNTLLTYFKLRDDWRDNHSVKALLLRPLIPVRRLRDKPLFWQVKEQMDKLSALEKAGCDVPDEAADATGRMMEAVFSLPEGTEQSVCRIFRQMGYQLGRWIYLLDAWQDRARDRKKKDYNVYNLCYGADDSHAEEVRQSLAYTLSQLAHSYELLPIRHSRAILDNIIYFGLPEVLDKVLDGTFDQRLPRGSRQ